MGLAGESIGLGAAEITNIAPAVALVDGTTSAKGCTTNLIGFGLGATSQVNTNAEGTVLEDFNATDDTVTLAIAGGDNYEPIYTGDVLTWAIPIP